MDYKWLIKDQEMRIKILHNLRYIPDKTMVKIQYRIKMGRKLKLKNPQRYSEKLQWYKLNYRSDLMTQCSDKYSVRDYIESKGLGNILCKLYAVYDSVDEININLLPEKFVMKTTNGSGTNYFCTDKSKFKFEIIKKELSEWLKRDIYSSGREWAYKNIMPRIIVEELLVDHSNKYSGINDYKFICLNGKPKYVVLDVDRHIEHKRNIYDTHWNFIDVSTDHPNFGDIVTKPQGFEEMLKIANVLCRDFPCVRVDLYYVNKKVYFGELTFYPWTGYIQFEPDNFDFVLGEQFDLSSISSGDE